jgi:hypothetical protein
MARRPKGEGRSVQSVKNSLKFKATPKAGLLSIKIGVKKYSVPVEARMIANGDFLFLSFPASSELYSVENGAITPLADNADASAAFEALNPKRRRRSRANKQIEIPSELEAALKKIPSGYRLAIGPDGTPRIVKTRVRRAKK